MQDLRKKMAHFSELIISLILLWATFPKHEGKGARCAHYLCAFRAYIGKYIWPLHEESLLRSVYHPAEL